MEKAGWLQHTTEGLCFPKFDRHNSESAKQRALTAKRVARCKSKTNASGNGQGVTNALPREDGDGDGVACATPGPDPEPIDFESIPELAETYGRLVRPLPAGKLLYAVFSSLEERHLGKPMSVVEWFRKQLSAKSPVTQNSEAELLLVLATAIYAARLKAELVKKNRVAIFSNFVSHGRWQKALCKISEAKTTLNGLLKLYPDLLSGAWPEKHDSLKDQPCNPPSATVNPYNSAMLPCPKCGRDMPRDRRPHRILATPAS